MPSLLQDEEEAAAAEAAAAEAAAAEAAAAEAAAKAAAAEKEAEEAEESEDEWDVKDDFEARSLDIKLCTFLGSPPPSRDPRLESRLRSCPRPHETPSPGGGAARGHTKPLRQVAELPAAKTGDWDESEEEDLAEKEEAERIEREREEREKREAARLQKQADAEKAQKEAGAEARSLVSKLSRAGSRCAVALVFS